ncbi:endonuclease [Mycobacterium antarcticum]|uniref:Z1 domain-containing protein n=1 Tax=unclassified Mycolicibacterium TaxID=2636767 RepID=UPI00238A19E0|nr:MULTISPECIES: Z1 domain-containing protein [unclassified Mycolicibacterium]BDX32257.1 endonuclease [Mycolicibacterium sp. TUM20985]GLP84191.1 endonuclease [Mycolicibacterium sp. TUM20984]
MSLTPLQMARRMAVMLLAAVDPVTNAAVVDVVDQVLAMEPMSAVRPERDQLIRDVEADCNVYIPDSGFLDGREGEDHLDWLPDRRGDVNWRLWQRYQRYLEDEKGYTARSTTKLDQVTDQILSRLENPLRPGRWDRRGMVVGQVQSGKTANYTGLICKAADAGYKLIVVLAGIDDSLRSQTQLRLDEGFLGYDTQKRMLFDKTNTRLGVGLLPGVDFYIVNTLTNSAQRGDFKKNIAENAGINVGGSDPLLLVVKKNKSILENLIAWATTTQQVLQQGATKARVPHVPLLVIDDECDHASVNTRDTFDTRTGAFDPDTDPTAINGCIRKLLDGFDQSAYIGYTATPFANIFIYKGAETKEHGEDLFPRSFLLSLKEPSDYIGATKVFGLTGDPDANIEAVEPYPIARNVDDADTWMPNNHRNGYQVPAELPDSLREAILSFVLVCAARSARGQSTEHNSMLVHVTRFNDVQQQVADLIGSELTYIRNLLEFGDKRKKNNLVDELRDLWEKDFVVTSTAFVDDKKLVQVTWDQVHSALRKAALKIEIKIINGTAKDALDYFGKPNGVSVIAVGGNKLSRGLTLEGLSVSYYLRASRMYDTLLQMGRWFGYRPGYQDLCRLFTTADLQRWYKNIALANQELLLQFDEMALTGGSPDDFGLRVRRSPDNLMVTAAAKMRTGTRMKLSYSGSVSETIVFSREAAVIAGNFEQTKQLTALLQNSAVRRPIDPKNPNIVWDDVDGHIVANFLDAFETHRGATKAQSRVMADYIRVRLQDDPAELSSWTVGLMSNPGTLREWPGFSVGCTERAKFPANEPLGEEYVIRRLVSPSDEKIDLNEDELAAALQRTRMLWKSGLTKSTRMTPPDNPNGPSIRMARPRGRGLLLIYLLDPELAELDVDSDPIVGIAASFPNSDNAKPIEYEINNVYWEQELASG